MYSVGKSSLLELDKKLIIHSTVQHYVIKFASDLRQFRGFSPGPPVSSTNKTDFLLEDSLLIVISGAPFLFKGS